MKRGCSKVLLHSALSGRERVESGSVGWTCKTAKSREKRKEEEGKECWWALVRFS